MIIFHSDSKQQNTQLDNKNTAVKMRIHKIDIRMDELVFHAWTTNELRMLVNEFSNV